MTFALTSRLSPRPDPRVITVASTVLGVNYLELTGQQLRHFMRKAFRVRHWREARSHNASLINFASNVFSPSRDSLPIGRHYGVSHCVHDVFVVHLR
jgi:hypothetical protein